MSLRDTVEGVFYNLAASGLVPRRPFAPVVPADRDGPPADGEHDLEIVSHCWHYGKLLTYQLSSLVRNPPQHHRVRMTVFYCPEDTDTLQVLEFFGQHELPTVSWNWQPLERRRLFRRSIGRNLAALATPANWIWFTDCDITFQHDSLDRLCDELNQCKALLAFPATHQVSQMLDEEDDVFCAAGGQPAVLELDLSGFQPERREKAIGGLQIVPGDIARAAGYCAHIGLYQRPADAFGNTREDRVFRWLLGTHGTPLASDGFYRIRHRAKGRRGIGFQVAHRDELA